MDTILFFTNVEFVNPSCKSDGMNCVAQDFVIFNFKENVILFVAITND